jgi:hypothetical protein
MSELGNTPMISGASRSAVIIRPSFEIARRDVFADAFETALRVGDDFSVVFPPCDPRKLISLCESATFVERRRHPV